MMCSRKVSGGGDPTLALALILALILTLTLNLTVAQTLTPTPTPTPTLGIWRRCTLDEYRKPEPTWELVLDLDALGAADGIKWVWGGTALLDEGPDVRKDRVMIRLSRGGSDATVAREFDLDTKQFISPEQGGFELPEAKSRFSYKASAVYRAVHGECRTQCSAW